MQEIFNSERWHFNDPDAYWTIQYEYKRSGADMQYRFYWKAWVRWSTSWYDYGLQLRLFLDGVQHNVTVKGVTTNNPGWSYEGTTEWYTVANKTTGTTQFYASMYDTSRNVTQATSSTYTLTVSPCGATLNTAQDFTDNDNPTITYDNPAGESVDDIQACISWTGGADIAYRPIPKTGTSNPLSYKFDFTKSEREALRKAAPNGSREVTFYVRTVIGANTFYSTLPKKLTIQKTDETIPEVTLNVSLDNSSLPSAFDGKWIQGKSRAQIKVTANGKYNATIKNISVEVGTVKYLNYTNEFTTNVIEDVGEVVIKASAIDTRSYEGTATEKINVIEYSKPLVIPIGTENAVLCYRSDGNGHKVGNSTSLCVKAKRFYYSVGGDNKCALQWRRKLSTDAWDDNVHKWYDLISKDTANTDEYSGLLPSTGDPSDTDFDLRKSYTIQIRAIDDIGEYDRKTFDIPTQDVALHLGEGGKKVTVGTYCDPSEEYDYTFRSAWKALFDEGFVDGTDTGWIALNNYTSYRCKCGYVSIVVWSDGSLTLTPNTYTEIGTLPQAYCPQFNIPFTYHTQGSAPPSQSAYIGADGRILLYTTNDYTAYFAFSVTYPI